MKPALCYRNIGDEEMPAPLMKVLATAPGTAFRLAEEEAYREELFLLGVHPGGVAGRLPPGGEGSLLVFVRTPECLTCEVPIELQLFTPPWADFIGWDVVPQPAGMGPAAWEQLKGWFSTLYGDRWRDFHAGLAGIATRLSRRAGPVASAGEIFRFAARQALGRPTSAIAGRVWSVDNDAPLAGATVSASQGTAPVASTGRTGADGTFAIDWLTPGETHLVICDHSIASNLTLNLETAVPVEGDLLNLQLLAGSLPRWSCDAPSCSNCDLTDLPAQPLAPPPSMFTTRTGWTLSIGGSLDPNTKSGPLGKGEGKLIDPTGGKRIEYRLEFQNDPSSGAAAHTVTVTDSLSDLLVPSSFEPTALLIADRDYSPGARTVVAGNPTWTNVFAVPQVIEVTDPGGGSMVEKSIGVRSTLTVESASGLVTWELASQVDPTSLDGLLLPDDSRHQGTATLGFAVNLRPNSTAGQKVRNKARAVFDDPKNFKDTNVWENEIAFFADPEAPRFPSVEFDYMIGGEPRRMVLDWDAAASDGTSYLVYVWLDGQERPATPSAVVAGSDGTFYVLPPDLPDGQYHWQVVADKGGSTVGGEVWDFTLVGAGAPPAAPSLRLPEDIPSLHPVLSWEPAVGALVYEVYLWRVGDPEPAEPAFPAVASTHVVAAEALEPGTIYRWRVVAKNGNGERSSAIGSFGTPGAVVPFRRGDADADGEVRLTDVIATLVYLFLDGPRPGCVKAADANDDGRVDIADPIRTLFYIYLGGTIAPPGPEVCGTDDSEDNLDCWSFTPCLAPGN